MGGTSSCPLRRATVAVPAADRDASRCEPGREGVHRPEAGRWATRPLGQSSGMPRPSGRPAGITSGRMHPEPRLSLGASTRNSHRAHQRQLQQTHATTSTNNGTATAARKLPQANAAFCSSLRRLNTASCSHRSCMTWLCAAALSAWLVPATGGMPAALSAATAGCRAQYCLSAFSISISSSFSRAFSLVSSRPIPAGRDGGAHSGAAAGGRGSGAAWESLAGRCAPRLKRCVGALLAPVCSRGWEARSLRLPRRV